MGTMTQLISIVVASLILGSAVIFYPTPQSKIVAVWPKNQWSKLD